MSRFSMSLVCALALLCAALMAHGEQDVPLHLTLSADVTRLLATPIPMLAASIDGPRYHVAPVPLKLTFTNTGDQPITLDMYYALYRALTIEVTGPRANSVSNTFDPVFYHMAAPTANDFMTIAPGASWTMPLDLRFPGHFANAILGIRDLGDYHMRFTYHYVPGPQGDETLAHYPNPPVCWQGAVASDAVDFHVIEAGAAVNGLEMGLDVEQHAHDPLDTRFTAVLRNVSDKPLLIHPWDAGVAGLDLIGDDGKPLLSYSLALATRAWSAKEWNVTLPAQSQVEFPLTAHYAPEASNAETPSGYFSATDRSGFSKNWKVTGDHGLAQGHFSQRGDDEAAPGQPPQLLWRGSITCPPVRVPFDVTAHRVALLKKKLPAFSLGLFYRGADAANHPNLRLQTAWIEQLDPIAVMITEPEAAALIDALAKDGWLREAVSAEHAAAIPPAQGYTAVIAGDRALHAVWELPLGWDISTLQRLQTLNDAVPATDKPRLATLLAAMENDRKVWEAAAALQTRETCAFQQMPLSQAAAQVAQGMVYPRWKVSVNTFGAGPLVNLQFRMIPAESILSLLATSAGYWMKTQQGEISLAPVVVKD